MTTSTNHPPHDWREARRLQAWSLYEQGWKQRMIAQALGVSEGAVSPWLNRGRQDGVAGLRRVPPSGAPPRLTTDQRNQLLALLEQGAEAAGFRGQRWTGSRIARVIHTHFGVTYHPHYVSHLLKSWGWSWQKPQKKAQQRDEPAIAQWHSYTRPAIKKNKPRKPHPRLSGRSRLLLAALGGVSLGTARPTPHSFGSL